MGTSVSRCRGDGNDHHAAVAEQRQAARRQHRLGAAVHVGVGHAQAPASPMTPRVHGAVRGGGHTVKLGGGTRNHAAKVGGPLCRGIHSPRDVLDAHCAGSELKIDAAAPSVQVASRAIAATGSAAAAATAAAAASKARVATLAANHIAMPWEDVAELA